VIIDPYPTLMAVMHDRKDNTYLLPTGHAVREAGSVTASNRSLQWREKVIDPLFESKPDPRSLYLFATRSSASPTRCSRTSRSRTANEPLTRGHVLREINRGTWTIGYTGQSPERLKAAHASNAHTFNVTTLRAEGGPCDGDYYGLPWPCWGTPELKHPGTTCCTTPASRVKEGGLSSAPTSGSNATAKPARRGLLAGRPEIQDGYPAVHGRTCSSKLGWWDDLTPEEKEGGRGQGLDHRPVRRHHPRGDQARLRAVRQRQGALRGVELPGPGADCTASRCTRRATTWSRSTRPTRTARRSGGCRRATSRSIRTAKDHSKEYPLIHTSGRLVEYEGGGEETRSNPWLAEAAAGHVRRDQPGRRRTTRASTGSMVWLEGPEGGRIKVKAMVTRASAGASVFTPFHFGGWFQGEDLVDKYPEGPQPYVRGEACNTATTYGYDPVTHDAGNQDHALPITVPEARRRATMARMKFLCDAERCIECNACVTACKNEHEVPWGVNRRRVVTMNDGVPGERSISVACMHCTDAPCAAVCPVDCFYTTDDGIVLHDKDLCIGCGYCFYACPFGAPQFPQSSRPSRCAARWTSAPSARRARGDNSEAELEKYGTNRIAEGKLPLCAEMCATKALLAGDGDVVADIYRERVMRAGRPQTWGWETAYQMDR
jgi:Fe-S-cluster-containing dehydrogenase component